MAIKSYTKNYLTTALGNQSASTDIENALDSISGGVHAATFTVGAEATNAITVNVQLQDEDGTDTSGVKGVIMGIFSDTAGTAFNTNDYDTIAAGTDGALLEVVADKLLFCTSETDGDIDVVFTEATTTPTSYLGVLLADGGWAISGAITHA